MAKELFVQLHEKGALSEHAVRLWQKFSGKEDLERELEKEKWWHRVMYLLALGIGVPGFMMAFVFFMYSARQHPPSFAKIIFSGYSMVIPGFVFVSSPWVATWLTGAKVTNLERARIERYATQVARFLEIPIVNVLGLPERKLAELADEVLISIAQKMLNEEKRCRDEGHILAESSRWDMHRSDLKQQHQIFKDFGIADADWTRYIHEAQRRIKQSEQDKSSASRTKAHGASVLGQEPSDDPK